MSGRVQPYYLRLDEFRQLVHSGSRRTDSMEKKVKYQGVTLDRILTWHSHIDQVRRKASQRLGVLSPLLNKRSGLSIRNGLILYRQLICPIMDYACPVWRHAADSHVKRLQHVQSKSLCIIAGAP